MRERPPCSSIPRRAGARIGAAVCLAILITAIGAHDTHAQGLFDFLLGGGQRQQPAPQPVQPLPPAPSPSVRPQYNESIAPGGTSQYHDTVGTGRGVTFCVRLCDGRYFPMERHSRVTPGQMCSAFCPASQTKVYSGSVIQSAVAPDGTRYADLRTAFVYRKQVVPDCSCNGRDPFGLVTLDARNDPTLAVGDVIASDPTQARR